jgi:hypothetical protein
MKVLCIDGPLRGSTWDVLRGNLFEHVQRDSISPMAEYQVTTYHIHKAVIFNYELFLASIKLTLDRLSDHDALEAIMTPDARDCLQGRVHS